MNIDLPDQISDLAKREETDLRSELPNAARDDSKMETIRSAVESLPTSHTVNHGDCRKMGGDDVELVVTSPPYFDLIEYGEESDGQLGALDSYEGFLSEIRSVWEACYNHLSPSGRICIVVGDVLRSRSQHGKHELLPLHADIQTQLREIGFDLLAPILWQKIGNASIESGDNARFLGKPYEPNAVVKNDVEYIILARKGAGYRSASVEQRILSLIGADSHQKYFRQLWTDINGEHREDHPAPYPAELAERLVRMFSFVGDTVLDPFAGTGSTAVAASRWGRNSESWEIEADYVEQIHSRLYNEKSTITNYDRMDISIADHNSGLA